MLAACSPARCAVGAVSYQVRVYKDTGELVRVITTAATSVACDKDLIYGQAYKWRVRAVFAAGVKGDHSFYLNFTPQP